MRKQVLNMCLTAILMVACLPSYALSQINGVYQIGTANDLKAFAELVNKGMNSANAVLVSDIDMAGVEDFKPIGDSSTPFTGEFDGQGHKIMGFGQYVEGDEEAGTDSYYTLEFSGDRQGFFGYVKNATIQNFSIDGAFTCNGGRGYGVIGWAEGSTLINIHSSLNIASVSTSHHIGGVCGDMCSGSKAYSCSFSGTITDKYNSRDCIGGIGGYSNDNCLYENCANYGTIEFTASDTYAGGICGYVNNNSFTGVFNSLNVGNVRMIDGTTPGYGGAIIGRLRAHSNSKFENNFWLNSSTARAYGDNTSNATSATAKQLASGEVCYKLNGDQTEINWFQTLSEDSYPVLDYTHKRVQYNESIGYYNGSGVNVTTIPKAKGTWTFDNASDLLTGTGVATLQGATHTRGNVTVVSNLVDAGIEAVEGPAKGNGAVIVPKNSSLFMTTNLKEDTLNTYTLLMDINLEEVKYYSVLFQNDPTNTKDGCLFIHNGKVGLGIMGYNGTINAGQWHRIVFVVNEGLGSVFIDGEKIGQSYSTNVKRWLMSSNALFFADEDGEEQTIKVSEIRFWNVALTQGEIWQVGTITGGSNVGPEAVDLGLPSGTLWATFNVGANSPEQYGDYIAWGETKPKYDYSWDTYKYCKGSQNTLTKYCTDSSYGYNGFTDDLTELESTDDAATANWGNAWKMPSHTQQEELLNSSYTITSWTTLNGVNVRKITSKINGKSIFLPAASLFRGTSVSSDYLGTGGGYWSCTLGMQNTYGACGLYFGSNYIEADTDGDRRYDGRSIRPVRKQGDDIGVTYTVSPSDWTNVPATDVTQGSRTYKGRLLQAKATVSGRTATFTLKKNDGSIFQNRGHIVVHSGSIDGTIVKSNVSFEAGIQNPTVNVDLDFTSGRRKYVIIIKDGDQYYYTKPIAITANGLSSDTDLVISGGSYFNTPILTTGKEFPFTLEIKNNGSESWSGSFFLKCGREEWLRWDNVIIGIGGTKTLTKSYTPNSSGRKTLTFYYQTGGSGSSMEVDGGDYDNPFTITVADPPSSDKLATPDKNTFTTTNPTETGFTANWGAVDGALYYDINVRKVGGDYASAVFKGGSSTTSIKVTGLEPGTSYQFQIRARNDNNSQNSDWSASIPDAVTTKKAGTEPANLSIYAVRGFDGTTPLTVGAVSTYNVYVVNNGASDWYGSFYLKDGDINLKAWHNIALMGNRKAVQPLDFDYVPESAGEKTLTLYYQTNTSGGGRPVNAGSGMNPMTVQVSPDPSVNDELKLKSAIVCPETLELGQKATISAEVQNTGDAECAVFLTDDNTVISSRERISPGQSKTINTTWEPSTSGIHPIALYYKAKGVSGQRLVPANGFSNPVSVNVAGIDNPTVTEANMALITKDCAPKEVIAGDVVFYHFRITDKNDKPLKGMKAQFDCTGSDKTTHIETSPSDEEGYAVLSISTDGSDAIASRGKEVKFFCTDFLDEQGNHVKLFNGNSSDGEFSLKIHKGNDFTEITGFDDVESLAVTLDLGASAKANLKLIDGSASLSFPLTTTFIWKDDELLTKIEEEARFDGGIDIKFANCFELSAGYYNGSKSSRTYNWNDPAKTGWAILMSWVGVDHLYTSSQLAQTLDAIDRWFGKKIEGYSKEEFFESVQVAREEQTDSKYFGVNGGASLKRFKSWPNYMPVGKGTLFPDLKIPSNYPGNYNFTESKMKFEVEASAMIEPDKHQIDLQTGNWLFGVGKNLKIKMSGDGNKIFSELSPAKPTLFNPLPKNSVKLPEGLYQKDYSAKFGAKMNFSMAAKEEEMYTTEYRTILEKISNSLNMETGIKLSVESMSDYICPEWMSKNNKDKGMISASLAIGMGYNWKMSSKGAWANYLLSLANNPDTKNIASDIYPVFSDRYAINAPITYFLRCVDEEKELSLLSALQEASQTLDNSRLLSNEFKTKDVLKIEQQESEKAEINLSLPIFEWGPVDLTFDCGLSLGFNYYPSESYYSLSDKKFFPVVVRSTSSLSSMCKKTTTFIKNTFNEALGIEDKNGIVEEYEKIGKKIEDWVAPDFSTVLTNMNSQHDINVNSVRLLKRHPNLVSQVQKDICTFTYLINDNVQNFDDGTKVAFSHFYPAGLLLGITDQGDTLFVVSEVCNLAAMQGTDTLKTTQHGQFMLDTTAGIDDLTPFGFPEDTPLDVYYSEEGRKDVWQYLGPAGTTIMTDRMGKYMMATSIKNDVIVPEILADMDEESGILHIKVNENIGLRVNTLNVLINGIKRDITAINESNFEVYLSKEDMEYMLTLYVTINDLAGNQGSLFQIFNIDKDDPDGIKTVETEKDSTEIHLSKNLLKVKDAEPDATFMLFSLKGDVMAKGKTDNTGNAQIHLNHLTTGVYVVTLSYGKAKKFMIK